VSEILALEYRGLEKLGVCSLVDVRVWNICFESEILLDLGVWRNWIDGGHGLRRAFFQIRVWSLCCSISRKWRLRWRWEVLQASFPSKEWWVQEY